MDVPYWTFGGNTVVTSSYARLTPDRQSKKGMLWNTVVSEKTRIIRIMLCIEKRASFKTIPTLAPCYLLAGYALVVTSVALFLEKNFPLDLTNIIAKFCIF